MNRLIVLCFIVFTCIACDKQDAPDCFKKSGDFATERRDFSDPISTLVLHDYIQIELVKSTENYVEISGPENLLSKVVTENSGSSLKVSNTNTCNFVRSYKKKITAKIFMNIDLIENFGTGDVSSMEVIDQPYFEMNCYESSGKIELELDCDSVSFKIHTGQSDVFLKGNSDKTSLFNGGINTLDAFQLISTNTSINSNSINSISANCNGYLFVAINQSGSVYYTGEPTTIVVQRNGSGSLIKAN